MTCSCKALHSAEFGVKVGNLGLSLEMPFDIDEVKSWYQFIYILVGEFLCSGSKTTLLPCFLSLDAHGTKCLEIGAASSYPTNTTQEAGSTESCTRTLAAGTALAGDSTIPAVSCEVLGMEVLT